MGCSRCDKWVQKEPLGKIDASAGRVYIDFDTGLEAQETRFRSMSNNETEELSLIHCQPITGRTHQIRAHLDYINLPIVGRNYGADCFQSLSDRYIVLVQRE